MHNESISDNVFHSTFNIKDIEFISMEELAFEPLLQYQHLLIRDENQIVGSFLVAIWFSHCLSHAMGLFSDYVFAQYLISRILCSYPWKNFLLNLYCKSRNF